VFDEEYADKSSKSLCSKLKSKHRKKKKKKKKKKQQQKNVDIKYSAHGAFLE
jgi:hypothetical protein